MGHPGAEKSGSPEGLEMLGVPRCHAANAMPLSWAGRGGRETARAVPQHCAQSVCGFAGEGACSPETKTVSWPGQRWTRMNCPGAALTSSAPEPA